MPAKKTRKIHRPEDRHAAMQKIQLPSTSDPDCEHFKSNYQGATIKPQPCDDPHCPVCKRSE